MIKEKKVLLIIIVFVIALASVFAGASTEKTTSVEKIKVLILPKFEVDSIEGDYPGEAQYYYEAYCAGGKQYDIVGSFQGNKLYVKDGVALYITGMGKVNASISLQAILSDSRFDLSDAYIISTGCAGSAYESTVMGDVFLITATVDFDLGHHADSSDLPDEYETTWFHDESYDSSSYKILNANLVEKCWNLVKDVKIDTTPMTKEFMNTTFNGSSWAVRDPKVLRGTAVTGDNYWKGMHDHNNAILISSTYGCPDPYAVSEMEDNALAVVLDRFGMLDHYIAIRDSVNMDVFMNNDSAASLWDSSFSGYSNSDPTDIFETARKNNFKVGSVIIDAILAGKI